MDQDKAYLILDALANGVDPISGECFPHNSPYNNPEVIRALFYILRNKPIQKKVKKSLEQKQQDNQARGLPLNYGLPWTDTCIDDVISQYNANSPIEMIAKGVARKPSSIIGLLKKKGIITEEQALNMGLRYQTHYA
ncbi:hypothetical protein [Vibrio scophthalmi]|uniref:Uncharacterized protein n=1 Tax=Vibrio scophthalmi TaxID=45658 RepID=A0A1E3WF49_9VIBR|nr:hypothetical protein [Vibrio scophthalmi]ODS04431.1 hypothetical protein VSF3289_03570 [Vibrio scophthalmi]